MFEVPGPFVKYLSGKRLNLGCGANKMDGFINADLYGEPDVRFDARKPWPIKPRSLDAVYAHHVLEHFDGNEIMDVFWEIGCALKDGGCLVAATPHALSTHQLACPQHKTGFTENSFHHYDRKTFSREGVSWGMDQGIHMHNWNTEEVFLVPMPEYEGADHKSEEFGFALRHYVNVIKELYFVLRKEGD